MCGLKRQIRSQRMHRGAEFEFGAGFECIQSRFIFLFIEEGGKHLFIHFKWVNSLCGWKDKRRARNPYWHSEMRKGRFLKPRPHPAPLNGPDPHPNAKDFLTEFSIDRNMLLVSERSQKDLLEVCWVSRCRSLVMYLPPAGAWCGWFCLCGEPDTKALQMSSHFAKICSFWII